MTGIAGDATVAVVGLGYVGLPVAVAFGARFRTIGYDLSERKVAAYSAGHDPSRQISSAELKAAKRLEFTTDAARLVEADFVIIAVPTPVDTAHRPDMRALRAATESAGRFMKRGAVIIFESTVYPGATEEVCVPILERESGLTWKRDFHVGYSPERINPGDPVHTLARITKVVAGDDPQTLEKVADLYGAVVSAGIHRASCIRVAEAAKVIENTQRDLNIALMNELAIIFNRLGLDTVEVLEAAGTKWNFLPFRPGLVGGHCIGVDPYYLTHKAEMVGYHPQVILAGRRINDGMAGFVAEMAVKQLSSAGFPVHGSKAIVAGLTFKEDCPDLRNSKVADLIEELRSYGLELHIHDPVADREEAEHEYGIKLKDWDELPVSQLIVLAVPHRELLRRAIGEYAARAVPGAVFIDVKSKLDHGTLESAGFAVWRL